MADRAQQIGLAPGFGVAAACLVAALTLGSLVVVSLSAEVSAGLGPSDFAAIRFTVLQAFFSAAVSLGLAVPLARVLARRDFVGRRVMLSVLGAPFLLPVIVAVLGLLAVFGRSGVINQVLGFAGLSTISIFGLSGVVLAHVFFNLPLATRLLLQGWAEVPVERFKLAASLGLPTAEINRLFERPILRRLGPGIFATVFLLCLTSFAVALTLGGGPKATTIELAIYQAFLFDFDPPRAAMLALVQFLFCGIAAGMVFATSRRGVPEFGRLGPPVRFDLGVLSRIADGGILIAAAAFVALPLGMVVLRGLPGLWLLPDMVWPAVLRSVLVALTSGVLALCAAMALGFAVLFWRQRRPLVAGALEGIGTLGLAASPLVIGTGLFLLLFPFLNPAALALPITALINATMSLPFVLRVLLPPLTEAMTAYGRLSAGLGLVGLAGFRTALFPILRPAIGFAFGLAAALSMGDLGVIALFADPDSPTLPLLVYRLMGAYRMDAAWGAALLLVGLSFAIFLLADLWGRRHA